MAFTFFTGAFDFKHVSMLLNTIITTARDPIKFDTKKYYYFI